MKSNAFVEKSRTKFCFLKWIVTFLTAQINTAPKRRTIRTPASAPPYPVDTYEDAVGTDHNIF